MTSVVTSILTLAAANSAGWFSVNDTVMGGQSSSMVVNERDYQCFTGEVSLENNGGFASVRHAINLSQHAVDTVEIRVLGDGKNYQLRFRQNGYMDGVAYARSFETTPGSWQTLQFHQSEFDPVWRGRKLSQQPPLSLQSSEQVSLMISDKQSGPFKLCIEYIHFSKKI